MLEFGRARQLPVLRSCSRAANGPLLRCHQAQAERIYYGLSRAAGEPNMSCYEARLESEQAMQQRSD